MSNLLLEPVTWLFLVWDWKMGLETLLAETSSRLHITNTLVQWGPVADRDSRVLHSPVLIYRVERVQLCDLYPAPGDEYVSFVLTWPTTGCSQSQVNARQVPLLWKCHSVWKVRLIHGEPRWRLWRKWCECGSGWGAPVEYLVEIWWFCRFSFQFVVEIFQTLCLPPTILFNPNRRFNFNKLLKHVFPPFLLHL